MGARATILVQMVHSSHLVATGSNQESSPDQFLQQEECDPSRWKSVSAWLQVSPCPA